MFEHNVLGVDADGSYRLLDEFLRVRLMMDGTEEEERRSQTEQRLLEKGWITGLDMDLFPGN